MLGEATGLTLPLFGGVFSVDRGKKTNIEINIMAIIAKTIEYLAFLLNLQWLKAPFFCSPSAGAFEWKNLPEDASFFLKLRIFCLKEKEVTLFFNLIIFSFHPVNSLLRYYNSMFNSAI